MSGKRQKNQLLLAFREESRSEAPTASTEGTESLAARRRTESPAIGEQLMEEVCERENCKQALARVKANNGSPGGNGMTVHDLPGYLQQHWPEGLHSPPALFWTPSRLDFSSRCTMLSSGNVASFLIPQKEKTLPLAHPRNCESPRVRENVSPQFHVRISSATRSSPSRSPHPPRPHSGSARKKLRPIFSLRRQSRSRWRQHLRQPPARTCTRARSSHRIARRGKRSWLSRVRAVHQLPEKASARRPRQRAPIAARKVQWGAFRIAPLPHRTHRPAWGR